MVEIPGLIWRSYEISSRGCSFLGRFHLEIEKEGLKRIPLIAILLAYIAPNRISEDHLSKSEQQRLVQPTAAGRRGSQRTIRTGRTFAYLCVLCGGDLCTDIASTQASFPAVSPSPRRRITFQSFSTFAGAQPYPSPVWATRGRR